MEVGNNRRRSTSSSRNNNGVVVATGSVWENRMKLDEVKGGFKVFSNNNNDETPNENDGKDCNFISGSNTQVDKKLDMGPKKTNIGVVGVSGKRKTWKTESSPIQIASKRSGLSKKLDEKCDLSKNLDEKCKDLSVSVDGVVGFTMKNGKAENFDGNQIQIASKRSDLSKNLGEKMWRKKNLGEKCKNLDEKSDLSKNLEEKYKDLSKFFDDKCKDLSKNLDEKCKDVSVSGDGVCKKVPNQSKKNSELRKLKSESVNGNVKKSNLDVRILKKSNLEESSENLEGSIGIKKTKSEEFGMCEEKFITSNVVSEAKSANKLEKNLENEDDNEEWDDVLEDEIDEEIEKKSVDVKEIRVQEQNKPKKIVIEEKKFQYNNKRQIPVSSINKKQSPPTLIHAKIHPSPTRTKSVPVSDEFQSRKHSKLQSLVDLVMWRNVSKSALVFGIGTFVIISSSYTQDLNISFISVLSCLGLVYLAAIFLFRSLIHRRAVDIGESSEYVVGEEEAVWILKLILPFINEFLLKIRALFSGDPSTTMKMAVLLFLLAKFGSYITIWKLSKLGFFGVFVIPKVCSSYSTQLTSYGTFLIMYIRDAWESCNHKKAVGFAIFTLVWNFSSIIARIWAVFMLYVGFRYYQQTLMREDTTIKADDFLQGKIREQRQVGRKPNSMDTRKQKKAF
ncbi:reticulon-like protein B21 isoform X7 [Lycium ferocissimum]|uniref:reticulon-like protein B21 isoform X7 n=1 Tax=Lycium ferocissimum TaxID=112874 RepID=UPI002815DBD5|nr:reticulon-like protein B21 isoform X7 [Lycium ferocissimum]